MSNLHELTVQFRTLADELERATDDEASAIMLAQIESLGAEIQYKGEDYALIADEFDRRAEVKSEIAKRYHESARVEANRAELIRTRMRDAMLALGLKQIKGDRATLTVVFGPHRVELAKDFAPELEFVRVKEEIDKSAIRDALKAGRDIPGASLVQEPYLKVSL